MKSSRAVAFALFTLALFGARLACGQWVIQRSGSTADFRGVHSVSRDVAWVSGSRGTVLRTSDGGSTWVPCSAPPDAGELDFRGVHAFDERSAVVMSAGTGPLSRVYRTSDGCRTWSLVFSNPDASGFFDAIRFVRRDGVLIGDPVDGRFAIFISSDAGLNWRRFDRVVVPAAGGQSLFAASNSSLLVRGLDSFSFITGGGTTAVVEVGGASVRSIAVPLRIGATAGGFSLMGRGKMLIAVGGDYKLPDEKSGTAARMAGGRWVASDSGPGGYRSSVDYATAVRGWIAVGPNGTDLSGDDGRTWRALKPARGEAGDSDRNWNAVSFPFVVGPKGRIGKFDSAGH